MCCFLDNANDFYDSGCSRATCWRRWPFTRRLSTSYAKGGAQTTGVKWTRERDLFFLFIKYWKTFRLFVGLVSPLNTGGKRLNSQLASICMDQNGSKWSKGKGFDLYSWNLFFHGSWARDFELFAILIVARWVRRCEAEQPNPKHSHTLNKAAISRSRHEVWSWQETYII